MRTDRFSCLEGFDSFSKLGKRRMVCRLGLFGIKLISSRDWDKVNVNVIDAKALDGHSNAGNLKHVFESFRDLFGGDEDGLVAQVIHVKEVRGVSFWNDERVAFADRGDVQEREVGIVLPDLVAGDIAGDDFAEWTVVRHNKSVSLHERSVYCNSIK